MNSCSAEMIPDIASNLPKINIQADLRLERRSTELRGMWKSFWTHRSANMWRPLWNIQSVMLAYGVGHRSRRHKIAVWRWKAHTTA